MIWRRKTWFTVLLVLAAAGTVFCNRPLGDLRPIAGVPTLGDDIPVRISFLTNARGWLLDNERHVWRTRNGRTWTRAAESPPDIVDIGLTSPDHGWARSFAKVFLTSDDGDHWAEMPLPGGLAGDTIGAVRADAEAGVWIGASVWRGGPPEGGSRADRARRPQESQAAIFFSPDAGRSWEAERLPPQASYYVASLQFVSRSVGFAVGEGAVLFSTDSGKSWSEGQLDHSCISADFFERDTQNDPGSLSAFGAQEAWVGYRHGALIHTMDGGRRWCEVDISGGAEPPWGFEEIRFDDSLNAWAVTTDNRVRRTTDGGRHWRAVALEGPAVYLQSTGPEPYLLTNSAVLELKK